MILRSPSLTILLASVLAFAGCSKSPSESAASPSASGKSPTKIRFQTDWLPQAEHGGFYQALAKGYYREAGLDVEILPGGPGPQVPQKMIGGIADMGMFTSDAVIVHASNNLPFVIVGSFMQHDPQAILLHEENPISTFKELNGQTIMALPGSNWLEYIKARHQAEMKLIPLNFSLAQFMADKKFIQQSFITNEPYYVRKNGAKPKAMLIADSGWDPYRVMFTTHKFLRENPEAVRAFVAATIRGWKDFMEGDPTPARTLIAQRNEQMVPEFMDYSYGAMKQYHLIAGRPADGETYGQLRKSRLQAQVDALVSLKIIPAAIPLDRFVSFDYLPENVRADVDK